MNSSPTDLIAKARELCRKNDASLLYLTRFGSVLYGLDVAGKSDTDARGIFLPSCKSMLLKKAPTFIHFSTGPANKPNAPGDIDIDLFSIQQMALNLLPAGDIGALDILFSPTNAKCTLYQHPVLNTFFTNPLRVLAVKKAALRDYCLHQTKKYGTSMTRQGILKKTGEWLQAHYQMEDHLHLQDYLDALIAACGKSQYCCLQKKKVWHLQLCGMLFPADMRMCDFVRQVSIQLYKPEKSHKTGNLTKPGEVQKGVNYKALSHALRAINQLKEILLTGRLVFPLNDYQEELLDVKLGKYPWEEIEPRIADGIREVEALHKKSAFADTYERNFAESCVLACYAAQSQTSGF